MRGRRATVTILGSLAAVVVLLLALAQLLLPRIAASRISSRIGRYGSVQSVSVSAWPAVKLLWGDADSVHVHARELSASPGQIAKLLWEGRDVSKLDIAADSVRLGSLRLTAATLHKHGNVLAASALTSEADVRAALPGGFGVQLLRSSGGEVEVRASGALFGLSAAIDAIARASGGRLVVHPVGFLLEGLQLTLFSDPHVHLTTVGATVLSEEPRVYRLTATATLG